MVLNGKEGKFYESDWYEGNNMKLKGLGKSLIFKCKSDALTSWANCPKEPQGWTQYDYLIFQNCYLTKVA